MAYLNQCYFIGNLTADPDIRSTARGNKVAAFSIAVTRRSKQDNGEVREETSFIDIVAWTHNADLAEKYLTKGNPVLISGHLKQDTWDDKETGKRRSRITIVADSIQLLGTRRKDDGQQPATPQQQQHYEQKRNGYQPAPQQQAWNQQPAQQTRPQQYEQNDIPF